MYLYIFNLIVMQYCSNLHFDIVHIKNFNVLGTIDIYLNSLKFSDKHEIEHLTFVFVL